MNGLHVDIAVIRDDFDVVVQFDVEPGETIALLGPNGAGKSTVVDAIAGLAAIDRGRIVLGGKVLDDPDRATFVEPSARRIGVVFQDRILFPHLTALENVAFGLTSRRVSRSDARIAAMRILDEQGLGEIAGRGAQDLSGGEAQRVALARALAIEPLALILDEPLAALDATARVKVRRSLSDHLGGFPGPSVFITHDAAEAFMLADKICVLERGRVTQTGSPDDIRLRPRTAYVADLAGVNLIRGTAAAGVVAVDDHDLHIADRSLSGPVLATIEPRAISIHTDRPGGSPRNTWSTSIDIIEDLGDTVRLHVGAPLPVTVEITPGAVSALGLTVDTDVWLAVKATEIGVQPA